MGSSIRVQTFVFAGLYAVVCGAIILVQLLPTNFGPPSFPGPALLLCITFAWVLRRPHLLPTWLIALGFLMADFLWMRPPGLWAGLVVIGAEYLRAREPALRELPPAAEFGVAALALVFVPVTYYLVLLIVAAPQASLGLIALQTVIPLIFYPILVVLSRVILRIDRMPPAEVELARQQR